MEESSPHASLIRMVLDVAVEHGLDVEALRARWGADVRPPFTNLQELRAALAKLAREHHVFEELVKLLPDGDDGPYGPTLMESATLERSNGAEELERPLPIGPKIGRFRVLRKLGEGGMGVVHVCQDDQLGRKVAVKLVRHHSHDGVHAQRMLREAQGLARLSHPNVVALYEVGEHDGALFLAMEYVPGIVFREWMVNHLARAGDWREAMQLLLQSGLGLEAAHAAGLIHRDFKPDNIIVGDDGRVRVLDFGLVRGDGAERQELVATPSSPGVAESAPLRTTLTRSSSLVGTLAYMAPEQLAGQPCTAAVDQFAFCVVAYEALLGARPFPISNPGWRLHAILARQFARAVNPGVPERVHRAILRGLEPTPGERWPSLSALLAELEDACAATTMPAPSNEIIDFSTERGRHEHFFGRDDALATLDSFLDEHASGWLLVLGGPGLGKSALLHRWLTQREQRGLPTAFHFIRRNHKNWAEPDAIRANLAAQIERAFPQQRDPQANSTDRLEQLLERVSAVLEQRGTQLVLLVDGLDEAMALGRDNPIPRIFPLELPRGVFVFAASRPRYPHLNWFERRTGATRKLDLSSATEANEAVVRVYWATLGRELEPTLEPALVEAAIVCAQGNLLHAVKLRERWQNTSSRSLDDIPKGFEGTLTALWEQIAELPRGQRKLARDGLALLCAARQSLPLNVVEELLEWDEGEARDEFLPLVREMLFEDPWQGRPAFRLFHGDLIELLQSELPRAVQGYHERLAAYAEWPLERGDFRREYAIRHGVEHLLAVGESGRAAARCLDVAYLTHKAVALGVLDVERELRRTAAMQLDTGMQAQLTSIRRVIGICSHWARDAPSALPALLHDRLLTTAPELLHALAWPDNLRRDFALLRHPLQTSNPARVFHGHNGCVTALAVLPNARLISGSDDSMLRVWDVESGRMTTLLRGHEGGITSVLVRADGRVVSGSADMSMRVWDGESGEALALVQHDGQVVDGLAGLADGRVVSSSGAGLYICDLDRDDPRVEDYGPRMDAGGAIAALVDGRLAVAHDDVLQIWRDVELELELVGHADAITTVAALGERRVISGSYDGTIRVWDLGSGHVRTLEGHRGAITTVVAMPGGRIASGSYDTTVRVWDVDSGAALVTFRGHQSVVTALAALPDGRVTSGSMADALRVWEPEAVRAQSERHNDMIAALVVTPQGQVISGSDDNSLRVWDPERGCSLASLEAHRHWVRALAALPDGRVVSASDDNSLRVWSPGSTWTPRLLAELQRPATTLVALADGRLLSGSTDARLRLWDVDAGRELAVLEGHQRSVSALALLPGGQVVSGSDDKTLRVWDVDAGKTVAVLEGHQSFVSALTTMPDGRIVSASTDKTLRVWEPGATHSKCVLTGHDDYVTALAVVDNDHVVSVSKDGSLRVWNLGARRTTAIVYADAALYSVVSVSPRLLAAGDAIGNVLFIDRPR